jgi:hypothetical protein
MRLVLLASVVLGCVDESKIRVSTSTAAADTSVAISPDADEGTDSADEGGDASDPPPSLATLERVAAGSIAAGSGRVSATWTNPINGFTYILDPVSRRVLYLTEAKVHPEGDWCIPGYCGTHGTFTAGRIGLQHAGGMCADTTSGLLYLPQRDGTIHVADVAPDGESGFTYNRVSDTLALPGVVEDVASHDGACAFIPSLDALLVSTTGSDTSALIDLESGGLRAMGDGLEPVSRLIPLSDGQRVLARTEGTDSVALLTLPQLDVQTLDWGVPVVDLSLDVQNNRLWLAHGVAPGLSVVSLDDPALAITSIDGAPDCDRVAVSPDGWVLATAPKGAAGSGQSEVVLIENDTIVDREDLFFEVADIVEPLENGDFVVLVRDLSGALGFVAYDAVSAAAPRPPLNIFVMAAVEQPRDSDLDDLRKGITPCSVVDDWINLARHNAEALVELNVSVGLAVTHNFVQGLKTCGRTPFLGQLDAMGLDLGYLVHNRPGYNCTNSTLDSGADICPRDSEYFCDAESGDCVFPGHEDYCDLGDQACYQRYLDTLSVETESHFPNKLSFVIGGDRHGMWGWDWVQGYQELARADGSRGYDTTAFAHLWSYSDQISFSDVRGKNAGPWDAHARSETWAVDYPHGWDHHSSFSDLVYLPGMTSSLLKLAERHQTGLFMLELLMSSVEFGYDEDDFGVLTQHLRNAIENRGDIGPNAWYFHLHDLTMANLRDGNGEDQLAMDLMRGWVTEVAGKYVERGEVVWSTPSEIRQAWSERR